MPSTTYNKLVFGRVNLWAGAGAFAWEDAFPWEDPFPAFENAFQPFLHLSLGIQDELSCGAKTLAKAALS